MEYALWRTAESAAQHSLHDSPGSLAMHRG